MQIPGKKDHYLVAICAITIIGLLLRLEFLPNMGSFWFDEMASLTIARLNFPKILEYLIIENNPPLSFVFLHFWIKLFGEGENIVRMSSLILSAAAIPMTYLIGKEIFSKKSGLIAALFMSLSFFQVYYSAEARMYPLFQLLALCSIYFFLQVLNDGRKKNWILYTISSLLLIYTHIFAWAAIIFQNIFLFIYRKDHPGIKNKILATNFMIFIFFLTWFVPKVRSLDLHSAAGGWYFQGNSGALPAVAKIFTDLFYERTQYGSLELPFALLVILLGISAFLIQNKNDKYIFSFDLPKSLVFMLLWIASPLAILLLFFPSGLSKYVIFIAPALYLAVAQGINNLKLRSGISASIILFISFVIFSNTFSLIRNDSKIFIWDKAAEYISREEKPGDKIIIHSFVSILEFKQYYKGKTPYKGFYLLEDSEELEKTIIKHNWNTVLLEKDYPAIDKKMKAETNGYKRIFLIESGRQPIDPYDLVSKWFSENNWRLVQVEKFEVENPIIDMRPNIWLWEKI
jgi:uncharacterized membrane protein